MGGMSKKYYLKLYKSTEKMIASDGQIITTLVLDAPYKAIISILLLPFVGLYCREAQEFYNKKLMDESVDKQIADLRNAIKVFGDKYTKAEKAFLSSDNEQDEYFKGLLAFDSLKTMNIHYNLGVYFDEQGHVLGNTQLVNFYLFKADVTANNTEVDAYKLGRKMGVTISRIMMLAKQRLRTNTNSNFIEFKVGYIDYNTNIPATFMVHPENKGLNLIFLHMLSLIGMSKYLLRELCGDNTWTIRCEYVISHGIWNMLRVIERHFEFDESGVDLAEISDFVKRGKIFFPSEIRNCMAHYDLVHDDVAFIDEKSYRPDILFYGLIESYFDGMTVSDYLYGLREYINEVEEYLNGWFVFDKRKISWDL